MIFNFLGIRLHYFNRRISNFDKNIWAAEDLGNN